MAAKKNAETFESAMERIEQIAARMESGELPLEELVVEYEEGLRLVKLCSDRLEEAEKRLQTITRDAAGQPLGLATVQNPVEIQPSTPSPASDMQGDSTTASAGPSGVRLH
ncbi:MAG TPA: exodeoxyribonuclease VII small subunit [Chthoniobacteraceae bacterium]|jgi:exodeoxyribonuclease VII small subunit|nr:exodeoxyribonuclease VII small subunit [Chthoniobacteraceae bacterium]